MQERPVMMVASSLVMAALPSVRLSAEMEDLTDLSNVMTELQ
jgi:hypothetical protein